MKWIEALRAECARETQAQVARRLGVSDTLVCQVLLGKYGGNVAKFRARVEGLLLGARVDCPVIGDIPRDRCIEHQSRQFAATNPLRVQLSLTCPTCPHNLGRAS